MENRNTYRKKLEHVLNQLPWQYDTIETAIVCGEDFFNFEQTLKEVKKFKELCIEEFSNIEVRDMDWIEGRGMVLSFYIKYNSDDFQKECILDIIEAFENNTLIEEEIEEEDLVNKMEVRLNKRLVISRKYTQELQHLIDIEILDESICRDILYTVAQIGDKSREDIVEILKEGHRELCEMMKERYDELESRLRELN